MGGHSGARLVQSGTHFVPKGTIIKRIGTLHDRKYRAESRTTSRFYMWDGWGGGGGGANHHERLILNLFNRFKESYEISEEIIYDILFIHI